MIDMAEVLMWHDWERSNRNVEDGSQNFRLAPIFCIDVYQKYLWTLCGYEQVNIGRWSAFHRYYLQENKQYESERYIKCYIVLSHLI